MSGARIPALVLMVAGFLAGTGVAEAQSSAPATTSSSAPDAILKALAAGWPATDTVPDALASKPGPSVKTKARKSFVIPANEIAGFDSLLNRLDYFFIDKAVYDTSFSSIRRNASGRWVADTDPFAMNQFDHPYQGSIYFGFARSAGLNYWTSLGYTFGGSLLWEIAGETGRPSYNDQITTGFSGTFLGEPLFRTASLLLEGGNGRVGFWRGLGAALLSPATGFNRLAFGERFDTVFPSRSPAVFARLRIGASLSDHVSQNGVSQTVTRHEATADVHLAYGLPGKTGYEYTRPFDYFDFQFTAVNTRAFENIMSRGLLVGTDYTAGETYRGVWGLYGTYDYISPQMFRVSSTALSLGTTGEWRLSRVVQVQGTLLGGVGYGATGITRSSSPDREYHYGATPQGLLALRLLFGSVANLDMTVRGYYVSGVFSTEPRGTERIGRGDAALTVRIHGPHTITLKYVASRGDARYPNLPDRHQTIGTFSVLYGLISDTRFGAVRWRTNEAQGR
jgi:hypothetical protein